MDGHFARAARRAVVLAVVVTLPTVFVAMPPTSAATATVNASVTGEVLQAGTIFWNESNPDLSFQCDPAATSTMSFDTSGNATGPYPGTFTESGTVTLGPQTIPAPISGTHLAGTVLTFTAQFQIQSGTTTISGTKTLTALSPGDDATNTGACASFTDSTDFANAQLVSASGTIYTTYVKSTYDATIASTDGTTTESGTASTNFGHIKGSGVTCVDPTNHRCVLVTADTWGEKFLTTTSTNPPPPAPAADLELTKTGPVTGYKGEELTYLIRVKNNGPDVATGVQAADTLPAGLALVSVDPAAPTCAGTITVVCGLGTLAVGETKTVTIVARAVETGPVHNEAHATANETDGNPGNNTGSWDIDVGPPPTSVTISKVARILTGPSIEYTIDVENLGPDVATGVVAKDALDPSWALISVTTTQGTCTGRVICSIGTLAVNQKETVTITVGLTKPGPVHNDASVEWNGGIETTGVTSPGFPDLRMSKTHAGDFKAGKPGSYSLAVSNIGTGPTTSDIVVTDILPTGMTFASGGGDGFTCSEVAQVVTCTRSAPLDAGGSLNFTINVLVALDAPPVVTNVATIKGGGGVFQLEGARDVGGVLAPPILGVAKHVKEHTVRVGHNLTYLIDVTNTGGQDATHVQVIDPLPASVDLVSVNPGAPTCTGTTTVTCNVGDLPVGQTVTVEIIVKPRLITLLTNEAFATADGIITPTSGTAVIQVSPPADLGITKEVSAPVIVQNSTLRYTITAKNLGPGDATNVKVTDPLPTGVTLTAVQPDPTYGMTCNVSAPPEIANLTVPVVCTIPLLPELKTSKVVLTVRVTRFGSLGNTATISSDDTDPIPSNDTGTATVLVDRPPTANPIGPCPYTVPEGASIRLTGAGTDPDKDALTYAWDLDGDGSFETPGQNPLFSAAELDGPSVKTVTLQVCDAYGACTTKSTTVTITNVAPRIVSATNNGPVAVGTAAQITVTATDVAGPVRDPLRYEFDCDNNGTFEIGPQVNSVGSCPSPAPGMRTVRVRVNDGDGGSAIGSTNVLVYAFPAAGQFVIGNVTNHAVGKTVTFWSDQWATSNTLTGGFPPSGFKGFENRSAIPTCGATWTTDPGNSSVPPATVPQYLGVIVSSTVTKSGSAITGDIKEIDIVKPNAGYGPSPGHPGNGSVVAVLCKSS